MESRFLFILFAFVLVSTLAIECFVSDIFTPGRNATLNVSIVSSNLALHKCALEVNFTDVRTCDLRMRMTIAQKAEKGYYENENKHKKEEEQEEVPEEEASTEKSTTRSTTTTRRTSTSRMKWRKRTRVTEKLKVTTTDFKMTTSKGTSGSAASTTKAGTASLNTSGTESKTLTTSVLEANSTTTSGMKMAVMETPMRLANASKSTTNASDMGMNSTITMATTYTSDQMTSSSTTSELKIPDGTLGRTSDHESNSTSATPMSTKRTPERDSPTTLDQATTSAMRREIFNPRAILNDLQLIDLIIAARRMKEAISPNSSLAQDNSFRGVPLNDLENIFEIEGQYKTMYEQGKKLCKNGADGVLDRKCIEAIAEDFRRSAMQDDIGKRFEKEFCMRYLSAPKVNIEMYTYCILRKSSLAQEITDHFFKIRARIRAKTATTAEPQSGDDRRGIEGDMVPYFSVVLVCEKDYCNRNMDFTVPYINNNFAIEKYKCINRLKNDFMAIYGPAVAELLGVNQTNSVDLSTTASVRRSTTEYVLPRHDVPKHISSDLICGIVIAFLIVCRCVFGLSRKLRRRRVENYVP